MGGHLGQVEPVEFGLAHRHADDAAGVTDHEGEELGGGQAGGEDDVALVLTVRVIDDDGGAAGRDIRDGPLDVVQPDGGVGERRRSNQPRDSIDRLLGPTGGLRAPTLRVGRTLLVGFNDMELLACTGVGRDINRHRYTSAEVRQTLTMPVVQDLLDLIRFRNRHPAFQGEFSILAAPDNALCLEWRDKNAFARLVVDLRQHTGAITCTENGIEVSVDLYPRCSQSGAA